MSFGPRFVEAEPPPLLLRIEEVTGMLRLSRATVYHLIRAGRIKTVQVGSAQRVPYDELRRFVATLSEEGGTPPRTRLANQRKAE